MRDLSLLQARVPATQPQLHDTPQQDLQDSSQLQPTEVESQPNSHTIIDLGSSPPSTDKVQAEPAKTMAPFPDMGMSIPQASQQDVNMNGGLSASGIGSTINPEAKDMTAVDVSQSTADSNSQNQTTDGMQGALDSELTFTDMEFSLAPSNSEPQVQSNTAQGQSFDLTTFAPADNGDDLLSLLPADSTEPTTVPSNGNQTAPAGDSQQNMEEKDDQTTDPNFNTMFSFDDGDGMDFDFSLDGGMGDTFNDLMKDRDGSVDLTGPDDLDAYFDRPGET